MGPIDKLRQKLAIGQVEEKMRNESPPGTATDRPKPNHVDSTASAPVVLQHANTFDGATSRPVLPSPANSSASGIKPVKKSKTFNDEDDGKTAAWGGKIKPLSSQNSFGMGVKATGEFGGAFGNGIKPLKIDPSLGFGAGIKPSKVNSPRSSQVNSPRSSRPASSRTSST